MENRNMSVNRIIKRKIEKHEELYYFIRASLLALQSTGGYGEIDFICPLCGGNAHTTRKREEIYSTGRIECGCGCAFYY